MAENNSTVFFKFMYQIYLKNILYEGKKGTSFYYGNDMTKETRSTKLEMRRF